MGGRGWVGLGPLGSWRRYSVVAQVQDVLLPTLKVPPISVSLRIVTIGALTTMLVPSTIRFGPRVAVEVASWTCTPESVWLASTRSVGQLSVTVMS